MSYILGINNGHDRAAFLLKNEKILVGIEQERLDRIKHSTGSQLPWDAIAYCLENANITLEQLDLVVGSGSWEYKKLRDLMKFFNKSHQVSHHLAHAYSTYFASPFKKAAIFVSDGTGNSISEITESLNEKIDSNLYEAESCYYAEGEEITLIDKRGAPNPKEIMDKIRKGERQYLNAELSLGNLYSSVSSYIFGDWRYSGKVMGLAPYGNLDQYDNVELIMKKNGILKVFLYEFMEKFNDPNNWSKERNVEIYKNLACKIQNELEQTILHKLNYLYEKTKCKNLCFAGGVALNCVVNGLILEKTPFENLYVLPAAGDSGTALGAAYYGYYKIQNKTKRQTVKTTSFGKKYKKNEILDQINWYLDRNYLQKKVEIMHYNDRNILYKKIARLIARGKIIGWFQGGAEIGPRALGNRSLLADARQKNMKDIMNNRVKHRESFRPFAPSVLIEHKDDYFEINYNESPFMLLAVSVKKNKRQIIPSVIHVDGTARIQTVSKKTNPTYYELIKEFYKLTGVPVILNTSFNIAGEPIVETPFHAIRSFMKTHIDYLVVENILISKK